MTITKRSYVEVDQEQAALLAEPNTEYYGVEVKPPATSDVPATVEGFVRGLLELQTKLLGTKNASPIVAYELYRVNPDRLRLQFCVPTKRLERKVRTHLVTEIPDVRFDDGGTSLPILPDDTIGGGLLTTGREDRFPLRAEFDSPPINSLVSALHRHAMRDTRFVVQILFQPITGRPVRDWWWRRRSFQRVNYLRKEKEQLWGSRSATPRERQQADALERKASERRFWTCIRVAVIGAGKYTQSRVKELAGAFNVFENSETGQYLNAVTLTARRQHHFLNFYRAIGARAFGGYSYRFQTSTDELAGLVSIPDRPQQNLPTAV